MAEDSIPDAIKRFILTSVASVPHLEAMLLLRDEKVRPWDAKQVAQRLYVSESKAATLLADLCAAGILMVAGQGTLTYQYRPSSEKLSQVIDQMAAIYTKNIVQIATLIHSRTNKKAQRFADAFKWREDS